MKEKKKKSSIKGGEKKKRQNPKEGQLEFDFMRMMRGGKNGKKECQEISSRKRKLGKSL